MNVRNKQRCLAMLCLYHGKIDGIDGPKTQAAQLDFMELEGVADSDAVAAVLLDKIKALPVGNYRRPDDLAATVKALCQCVYADQPAQWAYIMATVQHETAEAYYPVAEAYYVRDDRSRERYLKSQPYYPFYGRGLVQLTWDFNYQKYSDILGTDLMADEQCRDKLLEPGISLFVLVHGMLTGTYTGRRLSDFIDRRGADFVAARRVVNGTDKAELIAGYAEQWLKHYGGAV